MSCSVTLDIEYQGQTTRVEALVSTSFEDKIFLSWRTHQSLEIVDNKLLAMIKKNINDTKPRTRNYEETKFAQMERQNDHHRTNPCPGCRAKDELFHIIEECPARNKTCYNCGKQGHVGRVCRTHPISFKGMSQYPILPIRSINKPGTPAEQHKQWINNEPYRSTEIRKEITPGLSGF